MNKYFKFLFAIVVFPLLTLLTGCNSEGASISQTPIDVTETTGAKVIEITVTPSQISVLKGRTQQPVAVAKYDDGAESDVSDSVTWEIVGDTTVASIFASGLVTGNTKGPTELTASKDGITGNTVNVTVCDLAGPCIDFFDTDEDDLSIGGTGTLFTNSPSVAYLDSIGGGSATNSTYTENGNLGPAGDFYLFDLSNANALCTTYNTHSFRGRTNWRLPDILELRWYLRAELGNLTTEHGWPTRKPYWSSDPDSSRPERDRYYVANLVGAQVYDSFDPSDSFYVSCVSYPYPES